MRVITWNVKGLPVPLRIGGARACQRIAELLAAELPDVLVMQEAFTATAKAIARGAGYRNIIFGAGGTFPHHVVDSGLVLASLHPLSHMSRTSFGWRRSFGVDSFANKGSLHARVCAAETPVDVFTLHLNAHRKRYEPPRHARVKLLEQIAHLREYIEQRREAAIPSIISGDFNFDRSDTALYAAWTVGWPIVDASGLAKAGARTSIFDHQFVLTGTAWSLRPVCAAQQFADSRLSDHAALAVDCDFVPAA